MVSEIQDLVIEQTQGVYIPEFGIFDAQFIEPHKKYQGRLYRLSADTVKLLSESMGFTVRFDSPNIRTAYVDVQKTEGQILFDIDRNSKPTEINLRYMRDRWSASEPSVKERDALRPWIKATYLARFLPEKVFQVLADQVRLKPEDREHFFIRVNFKERTAGLIAEDQYVEQFPSGAFQVFALPAGHIASIPAVELSAQAPEPAPTKTESYRQVSGPALEPGIKYATYSKSEIDRMLRLQSDSITNSLSGKMSSQQRVFQDAVAAQEKAFAKITEKFVVQLEEVRGRLDASTKVAQDKQKLELEQFIVNVNKELSEFRAHINKNIIPISKSIDEKVQAIQVVAQSQRETIKPTLLWMAIVIVLVTMAGSGAVFYAVSDMKAQLSKSAR